MDRKRIISIGILAIVLLFLYFCEGNVVQEEAEGPVTTKSVDTLPMIITQVQQCARLYTAEYRVHKIVTHDDVLRLKGSVLQREFNFKLPLGDRKIAIPMDAKLKAYIDFSQFSEKNVERRGDKITLILPDPKVMMTSSKIDQKNVKQYVALARANFSDKEMSSYEQQGRAAIIQSIPELGIMETAQANAAKVLVPMLKEMGYKEENITISFRKHFEAQDIIRFVEL